MAILLRAQLNVELSLDGLVGHVHLLPLVGGRSHLVERLGARAGIYWSTGLHIHAEVDTLQLLFNSSFTVETLENLWRIVSIYFLARFSLITRYLNKIGLSLSFIFALRMSNILRVLQVAAADNGRVLELPRILLRDKLVVIWVFVVLVRTSLHHALPHTLNVNLGQEVLKFFTSFVQLDEKLLGVTVGLRA